MKAMCCRQQLVLGHLELRPQILEVAWAPGTTVGRSVGSTWLIPVLGKAIDCSFNVDHKHSVQSPIYRPSAQPGLSRAGAGGIGGEKRGMGSSPDPFAMWTAEGPLAPAAFLTPDSL